MSVRVILELNIKPELTDQIKAGLKDMLIDTRAFDGCEEITVLQDQEHADRLLVLEQWDSRESYDAYLKWRTDRGDMDNITAISTEPFKINYFDYVRA